MNEDAISTLDLSGSAQNGIYTIAACDMPALVELAGKAGLLLINIDLADVSDKSGLLSTIGESLSFPEGWADNWDALEDGLHDLSWLPARGYVLKFENVDPFSTHCPVVFQTLMEILQDSALFWRQNNKPFWSFFC